MLTWMVRAGRDAHMLEVFRSQGVVSVGWQEVGPLTRGVEREAIVLRLNQSRPGAKPGAIANAAGQLLRFVNDMTVGDQVVTYDPEHRLYLLGTIASDYLWQPDPDQERGHSHVRRVKWTQQTPRDVLSIATKNTVGSILTLFLLNEEAAQEIAAKAVALGAQVEALVAVGEPVVLDEPEAASFESVSQEMERAEQFIQDRIAQLQPDEVPELVAGILRAMGYRTRVSPPGRDRGVDITASRDGLLLEEPRIFVEVKHRPQTQIGAPLVRSFLGGRKPGDKCLYVSTGGFSTEAKYEADRSQVSVTLITLADLARLLVEHYEKVDSETRTLVPLRKVYWPA